MSLRFVSAKNAAAVEVAIVSGSASGTIRRSAAVRIAERMDFTTGPFSSPTCSTASFAEARMR